MHMSSIMRWRSGEIPWVVVFMTEAPVGTRDGSSRLATYKTEPQNSPQPTSLIEATPTYRASGLVHGSESRRREDGEERRFRSPLANQERRPLQSGAYQDKPL